MNQGVTSQLNQNHHKTEQITLGGGCFWCLEAVFSDLNGVEEVLSGYAGGTLPDPTYREICEGDTGHAEVVRVTFHPDVISLKEILRIFFTIHNPTTLNRQGADMGTQYRSAIFHQNLEQKKIADEVISEVELSKIWNGPVVTEVAPLKTFYPAEDYHQKYYRNNPDQPYCVAVIAPKVSKFRKFYFEKLKSRK
jgi:peptide-methionine (S)-S-oxide reductase